VFVNFVCLFCCHVRCVGILPFIGNTPPLIVA
jgi:hypothetical protein